MSKNTILNYFQRRPPLAESGQQQQKTLPPSSPSTTNAKGDGKHNVPMENNKQQKEKQQTSRKSLSSSAAKKRKRSPSPQPDENDEDEDYQVADEEEDEEEDDDDDDDDGEEGSDYEDDEDEDDESNRRGGKRPKQEKIEKKPKETTTKKKKSPQSANVSISSAAKDGGGTSAEEDNFAHFKYPFLQDKLMTDKSGRSQDHPDYDPTTLHVPRSFLDQQTPAQRQWWELKTSNFDTVLFFKMGKFYELFHMDALIALRECNLQLMKKEIAHCGFPEVAFQRFANILIDKGLKVARIEQVETPKMMEQRCKKLAKTTKFDKVVQRKICEKITMGTRTFSEESNDDFLVAICDDKKMTSPKIGMVVLNASLCKLFVGEFVDDCQLSKAHTLLTLVGGAEIVYSKSSSSAAMQKLLQGMQSTRKTSVKMPNVPETLEGIRNKDYFSADKENDRSRLPKVLENLLKEGTSSELHASMSASAFAMVVAYLNDAMIDERVFSFKEIYGLEKLSSTLSSDGKSMILFGHSLRNLDVLPSEENRYFNVFTLLDHTSTPFGRRLLKHWLCNPLLRVEDIVERQMALAELQTIPEALDKAKKTLKKMNDFEKLLAWIFASCLKSEDHPSNEAIFYETDNQSKKSVGYLISCLKGFESASHLLNSLYAEAKGFESKLLKTLLNESSLKELETACRTFKAAFDFEEADSNKKIIPVKGVDKAYDVARAADKELQVEGETYRKEQSSLFGTSVSFWGTGTNGFQLEVPEKAKQRATSGHTISSQRKGFSRYTTDKCLELRDRKQEVDEQMRDALNDVNRNMFLKFYTEKDVWKKFTSILATLDCLLSLHWYSYGCLPQEESTFPKVTEEGKPFLRVRNGKHPLMMQSGEKMIIPNDVDLDESVFVLTGANMGGKSTVMRQTATLVILAQLGCRVPAEEMQLYTVDRLFSRMGAHDNILEGESTFFVELLETASILKHATPRSLAIIDELGRGTTTHDGCAIASAVINHFSKVASCRVMFTTHYHQLTESFAGAERVKMYHMAMVEPEEEKPLIFLYKVVPGTCPKSHGFNAALCAGVEPAIVNKARKVANALEERMVVSREFFKCFG